MYKKFNQLNTLLSTVSGEVPTIETVTESGSAINVEDLKLFYIKDGSVVSKEISPDTAMELSGMRGSLYGRVVLSSLAGISGTKVSMNDIGSLVSSGDVFHLPYNLKATVLFLTDNDTVVIEESYSPITFEQAKVSRSLEQGSQGNGLNLAWEILRAKDRVVTVVPPVVTPTPQIGASGVLTGFRVTADLQVGATDLKVNGAVYDDSVKQNVVFVDEVVSPSVGDKYLVLTEGTTVPRTITTDPTSNEIVLCTFGRVYNPYEPERHGTVEGIPENWTTKELSKASFLWHPIAIDNPDALTAYTNFHNDMMPYHPVNSPLYGCQTDVSALTKYIDEGLRLSSGDDISDVYYDGGNLKINDEISNAKIKNAIFEGNGKLLYYMMISSKGDSWVGTENVVIENVTFSQFDEIPEEWNNNSDAIKPCAGVILKNVKAYNTPNDPFKIEAQCTYDGFTAYNIGMKTAAHCDGFQASGSPKRIQEGCLIKNGTIWMPSKESLNPTAGQQGEVNGAIYLDPDFGPEDLTGDKVSIRDITVQDCFFNGGIHTLWVLNHSGQDFRVGDVRFRNIMLGLDWSRAFAIEHSASEWPAEIGAIVEWENIRRIDNGELIAKPTLENYKITT